MILIEKCFEAALRNWKLFLVSRNRCGTDFSISSARYPINCASENWLAFTRAFRALFTTMR